MTFAPQKIVLEYLVMVYDRVGDEDKFSFENLGLGKPCIYATSHLKIEAKEFFS